MDSPVASENTTRRGWGVGSACLVIDAFDECDPGSKRSLLKFICNDLAGHSSAPKILFTSRPEVDVEHKMKSHKAHRISLHELNYDDIEKYVKSQVSALFCGYRYDPRTMEDLESKLIITWGISLGETGS
jgi:hypothetical protein